MPRMKLLHYVSATPNFGDDLNAVLWPALAPGLLAPLQPSACARDDEADRGGGQSSASSAPDGFLGIGTIIGMDAGGCTTVHVFSSGIGYTGIDAWNGLSVRYHCVRGPVSAHVLGLDPDLALTDGAVLAPLVPSLIEGDAPAGGTIVIPHFQTIAFPGWADAAGFAGMTLVDPRGTPQEVVRAIRGASLVLTESLHGAILADAFGVPWLPFIVSGNFSTAKWADWTASLGLGVHAVVLAPPDPMPLLRYGRRGEPFGTAVALEAEAAVAEFRRRIAPPSTGHASTPRARRLAKMALERCGPLRRILGCSARRTAEQLVHLAAQPPYCSDPARRARLQEIMLERLRMLERDHAGRPELVG